MIDEDLRILHRELRVERARYSALLLLLLQGEGYLRIWQEAKSLRAKPRARSSGATFPCSIRFLLYSSKKFCTLQKSKINDYRVMCSFLWAQHSRITSISLVITNTSFTAHQIQAWEPFTKVQLARRRWTRLALFPLLYHSWHESRVGQASAGQALKLSSHMEEPGPSNSGCVSQYFTRSDKCNHFICTTSCSCSLSHDIMLYSHHFLFHKEKCRPENWDKSITARSMSTSQFELCTRLSRLEAGASFFLSYLISVFLILSSSSWITRLTSR